MSYIVEVRYAGADWPDLVADMRSWLDRRQVKIEEFEPSPLGHGIEVRVGFGDGNHATAFASAFSGRLERTAEDETVEPAPNVPAFAAGEDASIPDDSATLGRPSTVGALRGTKTGVSLLITRQQKADLRDRGYTDDQIRDMKPEAAHRVLGLIN